jgi:hypothetical protein
MRALVMPALALMALTGCVESTPSPVSNPIAPTAADRATPAYQACVAAIAGQTGNSQADIIVRQYLFSEAATRIEAGVPGANAPWRCVASNDGTVQEVMFAGTEGTL